MLSHKKSSLPIGDELFLWLDLLAISITSAN
jgi:hypothetical protein